MGALVPVPEIVETDVADVRLNVEVVVMSVVYSRIVVIIVKGVMVHVMARVKDLVEMIVNPIAVIVKAHVPPLLVRPQDRTYLTYL